MRRWLPVLVLLAGLGNTFSFAQTRQQIDPFDRYLAGLRANQPEAVLVRFASECGVNIRVVVPRYAQLPGDTWIPVRNLSMALKDQETDFYGTAAVWHTDNRALVERWGMELDTGDFSRKLFCLQDRRIIQAEEVDWSIPLECETKSNPRRMYEHRWKAGQGGWAPKERSWDDLKLPSELLQ